MSKIRKIVIPVAGYGTRFLPFTKSIPKEMLPIVDRPVIQYIVEEAVAAGITEVILITGYSKRAIEDYFDYNLELEYLLEKSGKLAQKKMIRDISDIAKFVYVRQKEQLGNGHAILQAKEVVGDEPFVMVWGDEVYKGTPSKIEQLIATYEQYQGPVLSVMERTADSDYDKYGYVKVKEDKGNGVYELSEVVEKPGVDNKISPYAFISSCVLTPDIFTKLEQQTAGKGGEIWLVDALNALLQERPTFAKELKGVKFFDCGNKLEYLKATVEFALEREDLGADFRKYLQETIS
ncbi:MAG: UTP--glucose-1-phosphate uridylyltransferase [bacterium]